MIHLITGVPGAGKTLRAIDLAIRWVEEDPSRPLFSNVEGFARAAPIPDQWMEVPDGAIILIDEVQQRWRRYSSNGKPPEEIAALETHRHRGVDFLLTAQNPKQLSVDVRSLCDVHEHVWRPGKTKQTMIARFDGEVSPDPMRDRGRPEVEQTPWRLPRSRFHEYRSATIHTDRPRIPRILKVAVGVIAVVAAIWGYGIWHFSTSWGEGSDADLEVIEASGGGGTARAASEPEAPPERVTAYAGISSQEQCRLYDQEGRHLDHTLAECREALERGLPFDIEL